MCLKHDLQKERKRKYVAGIKLYCERLLERLPVLQLPTVHNPRTLPTSGIPSMIFIFKLKWVQLPKE